MASRLTTAMTESLERARTPTLRGTTGDLSSPRRAWAEAQDGVPVTRTLVAAGPSCRGMVCGATSGPSRRSALTTASVAQYLPGPRPPAFGPEQSRFPASTQSARCAFGGAPRCDGTPRDGLGQSYPDFDASKEVIVPEFPGVTHVALTVSDIETESSVVRGPLRDPTGDRRGYGSFPSCRLAARRSDLGRPPSVPRSARLRSLRRASSPAWTTWPSRAAPR